MNAIQILTKCRNFFAVEDERGAQRAGNLILADSMRGARNAKIDKISNNWEGEFICEVYAQKCIKSRIRGRILSG